LIEARHVPTLPALIDKWFVFGARLVERGIRLVEQVAAGLVIGCANVQQKPEFQRMVMLERADEAPQADGTREKIVSNLGGRSVHHRHAVQGKHAGSEREAEQGGAARDEFAADTEAAEDRQ
jgi:hypothetical protein